MLVLARHATTLINEAGRVQGEQEVGISELGKREAVGLARWLVAGYRPRTILASPARRVQETAEILQRFLGGVSIETADELRERDYGPFEGLDAEELSLARQRYGLSPHDPRQNWADAADVESDQQVWKRFRAFADRVDLLPRARAEDVLLLTHAGTAKAILCSMLGVSPDRPYPFAMGPASAAVLAVRGPYLQLCALWQNEVVSQAPPG
jgi:broad specificity phosphatase PhoE